MKLSTSQIAAARHQIGALPVPDNHPIMAQLTELYGSHTFFLDRDGLEIIESVEKMEPSNLRPRAATVVKLARWADDQHTALAPHQPIPTDVVVELDEDEPEPNT
jgi:hypothetical protein